jgi:iron complex transport system substrate-binding protein
MHDLTSIRDGIIQLGHLLNRQAAADELVLYIDATLDAVTPPPGMTPPRTLVCIGRTPGSLQGIYSLGQHDFLAQLLTKAGGQNLFDDVERRYPMVSKEAILSRQPEIIIDTFPGVALTASQRQRVKDDWQAFPTLPAVRNNRVFVLTDEYLHIPGPRVAQTARKLAEICQAGAVR